MVVDSPESGFIKGPKSHFWMRAKNNLFKNQKFHRIIGKIPILSAIAKRRVKISLRLCLVCFDAGSLFGFKRELCRNWIENHILLLCYLHFGVLI